MDGGGAGDLPPGDQGSAKGAMEGPPHHDAEERAVNKALGKNPEGPSDRFSVEAESEKGEKGVGKEEGEEEKKDKAAPAAKDGEDDEQVDHGRGRCEEDLEEPEAGHRDPAEGASARVKQGVAVFPEALEGAEGPAKALAEKAPHGFRAFSPADGTIRVGDAPAVLARVSAVKPPASVMALRR